MKTIVIQKALFSLTAIIITATIVSFGIKNKNETITAFNHKESNAIINADHEILTVINVITPKEGQQEKIIKLLNKGMTETMRYQKGFISANIHKSLDSEHVIVYAQWKDSVSLQEAVKLIETGKAPNMLEVFSNSTPDYHPYDVTSVNLASNKK
ncbi:antibiotic biosynthesis monooxygenase family protein [Aquimarina gracilis]|uniref:Antibiotic biosynthesis monooxygenase family protein n=1 Tax=Aquimarina gracilis TaxID=874422 RepID=A0ABU5ZXW1_9FLAO|nr:antibiotic biosynthesis monooxygenase family protein [Aquimarina gracilis]MEB3346698.1 antibiotic biosynthesis monooxygenase family protein [Aquimarina gracilis]